MKKQRLTLEVFRSYIAAIKNSVGSKIFRSRYFRVNGKPQDVLENGNLSCAYFVSSILYHFGLTKEIHTTVRKTISDMERRGWKGIKKPRAGSVLIYEEKYFPESGHRHMHIGFYIGGGRAVSTSSKYRTPIVHRWQKEPSSGKPRKVIAILWNRRLEK